MFSKKKNTRHEAYPRKSEVQVGPGPGMNVVSNVGWAEERQIISTPGLGLLMDLVKANEKEIEKRKKMYNQECQRAPFSLEKKKLMTF